MNKNYTERNGRVYNEKGEVAVFISPGFGAGFITWCDTQWLTPFEPKIVRMILEGKQSEITGDWCKDNGIADENGNAPYCGGASDLEIVWLPVGISFSINEYDGSESIYRSDQMDYSTTEAEQVSCEKTQNG